MSCRTCPTSNRYSLLLLIAGFVLFFLAAGNSAITIGAAGLVITAYLIPFLEPRLTPQAKKLEPEKKNRELFAALATKPEQDSD